MRKLFGMLQMTNAQQLWNWYFYGTVFFIFPFASKPNNKNRDNNKLDFMNSISSHRLHQELMVNENTILLEIKIEITLFSLQQSFFFVHCPIRFRRWLLTRLFLFCLLHFPSDQETIQTISVGHATMNVVSSVVFSYCPPCSE